MTEAARPGDVTAEDYLEAVLDLVARIPAGRVMTYGAVAEVVQEQLGIGGPRQVGQVLARAGSGVPWWRVVNASGHPPAAHWTEAMDRLRAEGCPLSDPPGGGATVRLGLVHPVSRGVRVVLPRAIWWPEDEPGAAGGGAR